MVLLDGIFGVSGHGSGVRDRRGGTNGFVVAVGGIDWWYLWWLLVVSVFMVFVVVAVGVSRLVVFVIYF